MAGFGVGSGLGVDRDLSTGRSFGGSQMGRGLSTEPGSSSGGGTSQRNSMAQGNPELGPHAKGPRAEIQRKKEAAENDIVDELFFGVLKFALPGIEIDRVPNYVTGIPDWDISFNPFDTMSRMFTGGIPTADLVPNFTDMFSFNLGKVSEGDPGLSRETRQDKHQGGKNDDSSFFSSLVRSVGSPDTTLPKAEGRTFDILTNAHQKSNDLDAALHDLVTEKTANPESNTLMELVKSMSKHGVM